MDIKKKYELKTSKEGQPGQAGQPSKARQHGKGRRVANAEPAEAPAFKTEEMLKQEARERIAEQEKLQAAIPRSERRVKYENFMYHYKWHTIAIAAAVIFALFFIKDTLFRVKPDITIVVATARYFSSDESDALIAAVAKHINDFNGDGKIVVQLDPINVPSAAAIVNSRANAAAPESSAPATGVPESGTPESGGLMAGVDPEMEQASIMKLMAIVSAWSDPLFLTDDPLYDYLLRMSAPSEPDAAAGQTPQGSQGNARTAADSSLFVSLGGIPGASGAFGDRLAVKDTLLMDEPGCDELGDLSFSLRPPANEKQRSVSYQEFCMSLLKAIFNPR